MWAPVFDPDRLSHVARLGYVFLAMPLTSFLGFVLYSNRSPLYSHYVYVCGGGALADQQDGGELMWVGGGAIMFVGFMVLAFEYARHESRIASGNTAELVHAAHALSGVNCPDSTVILPMDPTLEKDVYT